MAEPVDLKDVSATELRWLREVATFAPVFRDTVTELTRGTHLAADELLIPYLKAKAKLEGALNELRIAREESAMPGRRMRKGSTK